MKWLKRIWIMAGAVSGAILVLFIILNLLGWRENMTILTGTVPPGSNRAMASVKAVAYMLSYFGSVLIVPILLLATGISWLWVRFMTKPQNL
jgi:predicted benzoate:H+ symporter BenE